MTTAKDAKPSQAAGKPASKPAAKAAPKKATAGPAAGKRAPARSGDGRGSTGTTKQAPGYVEDPKFLEDQRQLLLAEKAIYQEQASSLRAEADSLAQEREPGDVQFDEESGEGGTVTVDRERDLALSAQALLAVEEIDGALARIAEGTYGICDRCHQPIPKARLKALPYARLCVACKSGGLARR